MTALETWEPRPNGIRESVNSSIAALIAELLYLCPLQIQLLKQHCRINLSRQINNAVNRTIRDCHGWLGWRERKLGGHLYREVGMDVDKAAIAEHSIPISLMVKSYADTRVPLEALAFYPVALISARSDQLLNAAGLRKKGADEALPFSRYKAVGIKLQAFTGEPIPCDKWSLNDHWALLARSPLSSVRTAALAKLAELSAANNSGRCNSCGQLMAIAK